MTQAFDPYHKWLGIPPAEQPANHYRLLGLTMFEGDVDAIGSAADQRMAHVRTFQLSQHAEVSQRLLNELAAARVCLLKPGEKIGYDRKLRHHLAMTAREDDDARAWERRSVEAGTMNAAPSGPREIQAGSPQAVSVTVPPRLATAVPLVPLPVASVAPVTAVQVPVQGEPVATARWLANERSKIAFYRLLGRSFWTLVGAIPLCLTAYVAVRQYRANQFGAMAARDDRHQFAEPAPNALPPDVRTRVAMTGGASPSASPPTKPSSQSTAPEGRVDFNAVAARQRSMAGAPRVTSSAAPRFPLNTDRFYPLDRVWFLGLVDSRWTDIRDRFEARQYDDSMAIKCQGENGDRIGLRRMIFHEEDPAETKMVARFRVERGSISFGFQSRDLSNVGETVTQELTAGHACIAESWLDAAARQGVARIVGAPQSGVVASAVPLDSYFAITLSGDSLLSLYELRFVPQTKRSFPTTAAQNLPPQGIPAPPELPEATVDVRDSEAPDDEPQADAHPVAEEDCDAEIYTSVNRNVGRRHRAARGRTRQG
ncbi:MAG TPA: hypothetical protein VNH11_31745 [Pirellulales bacterium]|nr:hypothetical protein [Pirellulales bacterium]